MPCLTPYFPRKKHSISRRHKTQLSLLPNRPQKKHRLLPREDPHGLAQAVDRIAKSKRGLSGGGFEEAESSARVARELVVVRTIESQYNRIQM